MSAEQSHCRQGRLHRWQWHRITFITLFYRQGVVGFLGYVSGQQIWDPSMRFLTDLPAKTDPVEVLSIVVMAMVLCFLFTLYPAFKAANTDPVQVLRYE